MNKNVKILTGLIILLTTRFWVDGQTSNFLSNGPDIGKLVIDYNHSKSFGGGFENDTNPPDFKKLSYDEAGLVVQMEQRKTIRPEYVTNLLAELEQGNLSHDNETLAIYLLGMIRPKDINSISFLIKNIDFRASKIDPALRPPRWGPYPAEDALIRIGKLVVNPIVNHLAGETNSFRRHLMCEVLVIVDGKTRESFDESKGKKIAQDQMDAKLRRETDPNKRANLETALKDLQNCTNPGQDSRRRFIH